MSNKLKEVFIYAKFHLSDASKELTQVAVRVGGNLMSQVAKDDFSVLAYMKMQSFQQLRAASEEFEDLTSNAPLDLLAGDIPELTIDSIQFGVLTTFKGTDEKIEMELVVEKEEKDAKGNVIRVMTSHEMLVLAGLNCMSMLAAAQFAINDLVEYEKQNGSVSDEAPAE